MDATKKTARVTRGLKRWGLVAAIALLAAPQALAAVIGGIPANQSHNDNANFLPFSTVTVVSQFGGGFPIITTIATDDTGAGNYTPGSLAGWVDLGGGSYQRVETADSAIQTALRALSFSPTPNRVSVGSTTAVTLSVDMDEIGFPSNASTIATVTSINDNPAIGGTVASQPVNDTGIVAPFSAVTLSDPDPGTTLSVIVSIDSAAKGVIAPFSLVSSGFADAGAGFYTFTGTPTQSQAAIRQLFFDPADNRVDLGNTETSTFTISVNDSISGAITNNSTTVVSTSVPNSPALSGETPGQTMNDNTTRLVFSSVSITDGDTPAQTLGITVQLDNASKGVFTPASLAASGFVSAGGGSYTFSGTETQATTAIRALRFDPTDNRVSVGATETTVFTISIDDPVSTDVSNNATTVISTSINDAPNAIGGTASAQPVDETGTILLFSGVTIADPDPNQVVTVTVTLDTAAKGVFTPASLTAGNFTDSGGGVYTFVGQDTAAQAGIRLLAFDPADNRVDLGSTETTTFTISVSDSIAGAVTNSATTVVSTNVPNSPVIGGTVAGQAVDEINTIPPFSTVTIIDGDQPPDQIHTVTVALDDAAKGVITAVSLAAASFTDDGGGSYSRVGITETIAQAAIRQLAFKPTENRVPVGATETTTFTITVSDPASPSAVDSNTTVITTSLNDAPVISGAAVVPAIDDKNTATPFAGVTISDVQTTDTQSVTVSLDTAAKGVFTVASLIASGFADAGAGNYTFGGTAAQATAAIRQLVFDPAEDRVAVGNTEVTTLTITVNDGTAADVTDNTTTVTATSINDAPTFSGAIAGQNVKDVNTLFPFGTVVIADVDMPAQTISVSIALDDAAKGVFTPGSLSTAGVADAGGGVYTFSGSAVDATTALQQLEFNPTNDRGPIGGTETTTFTVSLDDGFVVTPVTDSTVTVISESVNQAPVVDITVTLKMTPIAEDAFNNAGTTLTTLINSALPSVAVTELDAPDSKGVALSVVDNTNGEWEYSLDAGGSWNAINPALLNPTNALLLRDVDVLRFVPTPNFNGDVADSVTFFAWDQTDGGTPGDFGDPQNNNGGEEAFSTANDTFGIVVTPVNDVPQVADDIFTLNEDPGLRVEIPVLDNDSDVETPKTNLILSVIQQASNGIAGIAINAGSGEPVVTYLPNSNYNGPDTVTYRVTDTGDNGAPAATSIEATITITVTPVNDPPDTQDDFATTLEGVPLTVNVLDNDSDLESDLDPTSIVIATVPTFGSAVPSPDGTITYTANPGTNPVFDTFMYRVADLGDGFNGPALSPPTLVTIAINQTSAVVSTFADGVDFNITVGEYSLREAVTIIAEGGTITFNLPSAPGANDVLTLPLGELVTNRTFVIQGDGADVLALSGDDTGRIFRIQDGGTVTMRDLAIVEGFQPSGNGGAIVVESGAGLILEDVHVRDNAVGAVTKANKAAGDLGGAIYSEGTLLANRTTFSGNFTAGFGGAVYNQGTFTAHNSTFSENAAPFEDGGAIFNDIGTTELVNCTLTKNMAISGGAASSQSGNFILRNVIVAGNIVSDANDDLNGFFISNGRNIIGSVGDSQGWISTDLTDVMADTVIESFMDTNGAVVPTHALVADSPAINAGSDIAATNAGLVTDQRGTGFDRIVDASVDIGAYEVRFFRPDNALDEDDADFSAGDFTLREAVGRALSGDNIVLADTGQLDILAANGPITVTTGLGIFGPGSSQLSLSGGETTSIIYVPAQAAQLVLEGLTFSDGHDEPAPGGAGRGGAAINSFGTVRATDCVFLDNEVVGLDGGAVQNRGKMTLTHCEFDNNTAANLGGALINWNGTLTVRDSSFTNNSAGQLGGGLLNLIGATMSLRDVTLSGNTASVGGALHNPSGATLNLQRVTIDGNSSTADGGALFNEGVLTAVNTTISGNDAGGSGGAIYHIGTTATLTNCTVADNLADSLATGFTNGGGIFVKTGGSVKLQNTIVAANFDTPDNAGPGNVEPDVSGSVITLGNNIFGNRSGIVGVTNGVLGDRAGTGVAPLDPMLGPLANYGGTTFTHMLEVESPAIDNGNNDAVVKPPFDRDPATDQRGVGFTRIVDGNGDGDLIVDIGAIEFVPMMPLFTSTPVTTATEDVVYSYTITASDPDLMEVFSITAPVLPYWLELTDNGDGTALLTGTPDNEALEPVYDIIDYDVELLITDFATEEVSQTFTITITGVNDAPEPVDDTGVTNEDVPLVIDVLDNDDDDDGNLPKSLVAIDTPPANGMAVVNTLTGAVTYTPAPDFNGVDTFVYSTTDDGVPLPVLTSTAMVTVTVNAINDAPRTMPDVVGVLEDNPINIAVLANDVDVDGALVSASLAVIVAATNGTTQIDGTTGEILYTPNLNFFGTDSFTYQVFDNGGPLPAKSSLGVVTVNVAGVNDAPALTDDTATVDEDTPVTVLVLANDIDVDGTPLPGTVVVSAAPANGTTSVNPANGAITYTPNADYNGTDTFKYAVTDDGFPTPALTSEATVTITVRAINDAPRLTADAATIDEDNDAVVDVLANDTDVDGKLVPETVVVGTPPANGTVAIDAATGVITYSPKKDYNGTDTFMYSVTDDGAPVPAETSAAEVVITINAINDAPDAKDNIATTPEDTPVTIDVLANDTDVDGNIVVGSVDIVDEPVNGTAAVSPVTGKVLYTPFADFNGTDTFTYQVVDDGSPLPALASIARVTVSVTAVNDAPRLVNDTATIDEDGTAIVDVLANDSDVDGTLQSQSVAVTTPPVGGKTAVNLTNGNITYTPNPDYNGVDTFTYRVVDDGSPTPTLSSTATVTITVNAVNDAPRLKDDLVFTDEDVVVGIPTLANDTDVDGSLVPASVVIVSGPDHGFASVSLTTGDINYIPEADYNGVDTIVYAVSDNGSPVPALTSQANINITVNAINDAPRTQPDLVDTNEDIPLVINVYENDVDVDGGLVPSTVQIDQAPASGVAVVDPLTGLITYTPAADFNGVDTFTYLITDDGFPLPAQTGAGSVTITVNPINDAPRLEDDTATTDEDTPVVIDLAGNDIDVDGELNMQSLSITTQPLGGTLSLDRVTGMVTYTPHADFNGVDTFTYALADDGNPPPLRQGTAEVTVTVVAVDDAPRTQPDSASTDEDTPVIVDVLANDTDVDGELVTASVTVVSGPANGTTTVNPDTGAVTYTPGADFNGDDTFTYEVLGRGTPGEATSAGVVTIAVRPVNDAPRLMTDSADTPEDTAINVDVLANDTDVDGALVPSSVTVTTAPRHGTTTVNPATGVITYTPALDYNGTDSFVYQVSDDGAPLPALSSEAIVMVNIGARNDAVVANDDSASTPEDTPVSVDVVANDTDVDGNVVLSTLVVTANAANGTVVVDNDTGSITYTPALNFNGEDVFTYRIADDGTPLPEAFDTADVTITVTAVNDAPEILAPSNALVFQGNNLSFASVAISDVDDGETPGAELRVDLEVDNGVLTLTPTSTVTVLDDNAASLALRGPKSGLNATLATLHYTNGDGYYGPDTLTVTVDDLGNTGSGTNAPTVRTIPVEVVPLLLVVTKLDDTIDGNVSVGEVTLREAIDAIGVGGTVRFAEGITGTLLLDSTLGELRVRKPMTIEGPQAGEVVLSGGLESRVIRVDDGDGVANRNVTLRMLSLTEGNATGGGNGGGVLNAENLTLDRVRIFGNSAQNGGGVYNLGLVTLNGTTVSGNDADSLGGGVANVSEGRLTIRASALTQNDGRNGGAVSNTGSSTTIVNSTLSGNRAVSNGGGYYHGAAETALLVNNTITDNLADPNNTGSGNGGGVFVLNSAAAVSVTNNILAGNFDTQGNTGAGVIHPNVSGAFVAQRNNIVGSTAGSTNFGGADILLVDETAATLATVFDPSLTENGGPTLTHAAAFFGPAIDAGDATAVTAAAFGTLPATDQRLDGFVRVSGKGVDVGAYELQALNNGNLSLVIARAADQLEVTAFTPVVFDITFGEVVNGFDLGDIVQVGTATITSELDSLGDGQYRLRVQPTTPGTILPTIAADLVSDSFGNTNPAFNDASITVTYEPDRDADGDGVLDIDEGRGDADGDGIPNFLDLDSDNDGVPDSVEALSGSDPFDPANPDTTVGFTPPAINAGAEAGVQGITVTRYGTGNFNWSVALVQGAEWLQLEGDTAGTNDGAFAVRYDTNAVGAERVAQVVLTADREGAGLPRTLVITQAMCTLPDAPQNVAATVIDNGSTLQVSWSPVAGATAYQIWRNIDTPEQVATVTDTSFEISIPGGCLGGTDPSTFSYWLIAVNDCGESDPATAAKSDDKAIVQPVLPAAIDADGRQVAGPFSPLAVRLGDNAGIAVDTIAATLSANDDYATSVSWQPLDARDTDGWVIVAADAPWRVGDVITLRVAADNQRGEHFDDRTFTFIVSGDLRESVTQPAKGTDYVGLDEGISSVALNAQTGGGYGFLEGGAGKVYGIDPDAVFNAPRRVWIPVGDLDADTAIVHLHIDGRWVSARDTVGWLVPGSEVILDGVDQAYLGLLVNHGAVVQLATPDESAGRQAAAVPGGRLGEMVLMAMMFAVFIGTARQNRIKHVPVAIHKSARR